MLILLLQEVALIGEYEGSVEDLGDAEVLLFQLQSIPLFRSKLTLIQNMLSFDAVSLQSAAEAYNSACIQLCESPSLLKLLSILLSHANFLNAGRGGTMQVNFTFFQEPLFYYFHHDCRASECLRFQSLLNAGCTSLSSSAVSRSL
jgi:hypothetical protein